MLFCMDTQLKKWRFTEYGNRIGLMLAQSGEVVLSFPFKDAILEGGMSREDTGREERFFHEVVDRSDIDTLQDRKVLTSFRRIDSSGDHEITSSEEVEFFDSEWELRSNLLIKGNNLVALYTLRDRLADKVKLIYIDPPYNTGNDGFRYNDNFNHSTWLAFMKNRLEIARELLRDDGVIFVQCDDNEQAYLKVLMDEVFGREQTECLVWRKSWSGRDWKMKNTTTFRKDHEYIVLGFRNEKTLNKSLEKPNWENEQKNPDNDPRGNWLSWSISRTEEASNLSHKNYYSVKSPSGRIFTRQFDVSEEEFKKLDSDNRISWWSNNDATPRIKIFEDEERETNTSSLILFNGNSTEWKKELEFLFGNINEFSTPKPESLIQKIIQISTQPWDIVLDYHLGSGTTAAVAHKMGRRWIGIEQMDYIEDIAKVRIQKVIEGEQGGISKSVGWQWGGEFVYLELKTYNEEYLERIELARTKEELHRVYADMARNAFLQFWFDRRDFERDGYKALPLEEQRVKLREILDLNHLYLNYHDMRDARHRVSPIDQSLTDAFYGS